MYVKKYTAWTFRDLTAMSTVMIDKWSDRVVLRINDKQVLIPFSNKKEYWTFNKQLNRTKNSRDKTYIKGYDLSKQDWEIFNKYRDQIKRQILAVKIEGYC